MKPTAFFDVECYPNFWCVSFVREVDGVRRTYERSARKDFDPKKLAGLLRLYKLVGFNSRAYDLPMVMLAIRGATNAQLKLASDRIIRSRMNWWDSNREFKIDASGIDHVDLFEVNPGIKQSLKTCAARLHYPHLQDLPYEPDHELSEPQMDEVIEYNFSDLGKTESLYDSLKGALELRENLSAEYDLDLRSLSDAQMGEKIFKHRMGRKFKPLVAVDEFHYEAPEWITFKTEQMAHALYLAQTLRFEVSSTNRTELPKQLEELKISAGGAVLQMGIGGLHSTESNRCIVASANRRLIDVDVASQYPNIIAKLGLGGAAFAEAYRAIIRDRMAAKRDGKKHAAEGLKIALNGGVFGKFGSSYSALFSPHNLVATTLTGQFSLLMLIEAATEAGIGVASANTDGVTFDCPAGLQEALRGVISAWETATGFELEVAPYAGLYAESVNTYIAVKPDGTTKRKGYLADYWSAGDYRGMLMHNPQMTICSNAVVAWLTRHVPIERTIRECRDMRQFVTCTNVTGGAMWRGSKLGRVVRYYWSTNGEPILRCKPHPKTGNHGKVPKTDGACPMMILRPVPADLDYQRYIDEANAILLSLGYSSEMDLPDLGVIHGT